MFNFQLLESTIEMDEIYYSHIIDAIKSDTRFKDVCGLDLTKINYISYQTTLNAIFDKIGFKHERHADFSDTTIIVPDHYAYSLAYFYAIQNIAPFIEDGQYMYWLKAYDDGTEHLFKWLCENGEIKVFRTVLDWEEINDSDEVTQ